MSAPGSRTTQRVEEQKHREKGAQGASTAPVGNTGSSTARCIPTSVTGALEASTGVHSPAQLSSSAAQVVRCFETWTPPGSAPPPSLPCPLPPPGPLAPHPSCLPAFRGSTGAEAGAGEECQALSSEGPRWWVGSFTTLSQQQAGRPVSRPPPTANTLAPTPATLHHSARARHSTRAHDIALTHSHTHLEHTLRRVAKVKAALAQLLLPVVALHQALGTLSEGRMGRQRARGARVRPKTGVRVALIRLRAGRTGQAGGHGKLAAVGSTAPGAHEGAQCMRPDAQTWLTGWH